MLCLRWLDWYHCNVLTWTCSSAYRFDFRTPPNLWPATSARPWTHQRDDLSGSTCPLSRTHQPRSSSSRCRVARGCQRWNAASCFAPGNPVDDVDNITSDEIQQAATLFSFNYNSLTIHTQYFIHTINLLDFRTNQGLWKNNYNNAFQWSALKKWTRPRDGRVHRDGRDKRSTKGDCGIPPDGEIHNNNLAWRHQHSMERRTSTMWRISRMFTCFLKRLQSQLDMGL